MPQVENSTPRNQFHTQNYQKYYTKLPSGYVYKVCKTYVNFMFTFNSIPVYVNIPNANKIQNLKYFQSKAFWISDTQCVVINDKTFIGLLSYNFL